MQGFIQGFIEPILFLTAVVLLWRTRKAALPGSSKNVIIVMLSLSVVSQLILFWVVLPSYTGEDIPVAVALSLPIFYGFEVYVITRLALVYTSGLTSGGFALLRASSSKSTTYMWTGLGGTLVAVGLVVVYSLAFDQRFFPDQPSLLMGLGAGFTNLTREEVLFRLGAQTMLAHALKKYRYGIITAAVGSALLFELWHNPFAEINGLNFLISIAFATLYHRWGYEAAAAAHALSDVAVFYVLPTVWPR